ncbi:uncharacterized protein SAPINGB_P002194 [Magnusiomyces paraingens]|uniref:Uncharacterized protein n=1 Tax=Magnusiomyces paraingens TaxID=2606893 RepID=A0A5E8BE07_9ASCO|nr:uncharacterized protein SAPINGB_P002194 [Saprochaete ingens]VVT49282.1 unnamed protein product [Saprochaete ingens]
MSSEKRHARIKASLCDIRHKVTTNLCNKQNHKCTDLVALSVERVETWTESIVALCNELELLVSDEKIYNQGISTSHEFFINQYVALNDTVRRLKWELREKQIPENSKKLLKQELISIKDPEESTFKKESQPEETFTEELETENTQVKEPELDIIPINEPGPAQKRVHFEDKNLNESIQFEKPANRQVTKYIDVKIPGLRAKNNTRKLSATQEWAVNTGTVNLRRGVNRYSSIFSHEYQFTDSGLVRLQLKEGAELTQADYKKMPATWTIDLNNNLA